jgi:hypothetical protein
LTASTIGAIQKTSKGNFLSPLRSAHQRSFARRGGTTGHHTGNGVQQVHADGQGFVRLKTLDDVLKAVEVSESYYEDNRRAAREVAAEVFATQKVIGRLMEGARV